MPLFRPKKLSLRGIFVELMPRYFRTPKHPQQSLKGEPRTMKVPWDADELFHRIRFKEKIFQASLMAKYEQKSTLIAPRSKGETWCVMTGRHVPRAQVRAAHIFPKELGTSMMSFACTFIDLWSPENGLMLPKPAIQALDDLALTIVPPTPHKALHHFAKDYKFRVMDFTHPAMSQMLFHKATELGLPELTTAQLDDSQLRWSNNHRPKLSFLYLRSCCAVWKKTYLEDPECDDETDYAKRFLRNISEYWHPQFVRRSRITDIFLLKHRETPSPNEPPPNPRDIETRYRANPLAAQILLDVRDSTNPDVLAQLKQAEANFRRR